jgi:hypothetical protein
MAGFPAPRWNASEIQLSNLLDLKAIEEIVETTGTIF